MLDFEAQSLFRLGRLEECIDTYDKRIAAADLTPAKKSHLLHGKAQRLLGGDRIAESIRAWRVYRESTEQGTDDWCDATALLARELRRDRRHEDAIKLIRELLPTYRHPWVLLDAAESCFALNDGKAAMSFIEECRTLNSKFAKSERKGERDLAERVEARIKRMMEMASTKLPKPSGEDADGTKR